MLLNFLEKHMKTTKKIFLGLFSGGMVLLLTFTSAMGQSGSGKLKNYAFAKNDLIVDTTSTALTPVPEMNLKFKTAGDALIRFCANGNMFGTGTGAIQVSAKLDGVQIRDEIQFFTSDDFAVVPRCFDWIAENPKKGEHKIVIYWRMTSSSGSSLTGRFHDSVLTVLY